MYVFMVRGLICGVFSRSRAVIGAAPPVISRRRSRCPKSFATSCPPQTLQRGQCAAFRRRFHFFPSGRGDITSCSRSEACHLRHSHLTVPVLAACGCAQSDFTVARRLLSARRPAGPDPNTTSETLSSWSAKGKTVYQVCRVLTLRRPDLTGSEQHNKR